MWDQKNLEIEKSFYPFQNSFIGLAKVFSPIRCSICPSSHCLELQRRQNASCLVSSSTILLTSLVFLVINIIVMKLDQVMIPSEREIHRSKDRILKDLLFILSDFYVQMIHIIYNDHLIL